MHLAVCAVGILYIGAYLEKLLGWERVVIGFVAGTLGGALGQILLAPPVPGVGAGGALFGLFGLLGAVALLKRRLPPTLVPHSGFWILTVFLALLLPATAEPPVPPPHIPLGIVSPEVAAAILRELVAITSMYIGGAALGFLVGVIIVLGLDIPASDESRRGARPFALLGCLALGIGLVGGVTLPRKNHALDTEIVGRALIDLPKGDESAALQNAIAYPRLTDSRSKPEAIEMAARLAAAAVDNTDRENPVALRTLAFARYQQGQVGEARSLISEAIRLVKDRPDLPDTLMLKELQQHEEDMDKGTTLRPPAPPDDLDR
jgi:membrane associated rhomboid family serine protease